MTSRVGDPSAIVIRPVQGEEWQQYRDLRLNALESDPLAFGSTLRREQGFAPEVWKDRISQGRQTLVSCTWVAVNAAGRFVGTTAAVDMEGRVHIFAMWVDPEYRDVGIGGRLLDAALTWIRETHPARAVVLDVNPRQIAAVRLYESRGFRSTGSSSPLPHTPGERTIEMTLPAADPETGV